VEEVSKIFQKAHVISVAKEASRMSNNLWKKSFYM